MEDNKMQEKDLKNISIDNTEEVYTLSTLEGEEKEYRKILEFTNPTNGNLYYIFAEEETIDEEFKTSELVRVNSLAIAFPFVRSFISTFSINAGIPPFILPAYNFSEKE